MGLPEEWAEKMVIACEHDGALELDTVLDKARIMLSRPVAPTTVSAATTAFAQSSPKKRFPSGPIPEDVLRKMRCFNCNEWGHLSKACTKPKKQKNSPPGACGATSSQ
jgi:hypothetical protein